MNADTAPRSDSTPLALQAVQALLSGTDTEFAASTHSTGDRGHGRTERRTIRVAPCDDNLFPGARQVFRLRRDTGGLDGVRTSKQIIHGIVSLDTEQAGPQQLNAYARGHWSVEIVCTGPETSPSTRTIPSSGPVRLPVT